MDYGNTATCTEMRAVTPELMAVRCQAVLCQMEGVSFVGIEGEQLVRHPLIGCGLEYPALIG